MTPTWKQFRQEIHHLAERGWNLLCGVKEFFWLHPNDKFQYTHGQALVIEKVRSDERCARVLNECDTNVLWCKGQLIDVGEGFTPRFYRQKFSHRDYNHPKLYCSNSGYMTPTGYLSTNYVWDESRKCKKNVKKVQRKD